MGKKSTASHDVTRFHADDNPSTPSAFDRRNFSKISSTAAAVAGAAAMTALPVWAESGIYPWLISGDQLRGSLSVDGEVVCKLDYKATHDHLAADPVCSFTVAPGAEKASLEGTLTTEGQAAKFEQSWHLVDVAPVTEALYQQDLSLSDRVQKLIDRLEGWAEEHGIDVAEYLDTTPREVDSKAAFAAAEQRLGLSLPPALEWLAAYDLEVGHSDLRRRGAHSSSLAPEDWVRFMEELEGDWGYPKGDLDSLPAATRERFERSILVFTYVGDGLGALAWDPDGVREGESSNVAGVDPALGAVPGPEGEGAWFWVHQDTLVAPTLLLGRDRRPRPGDSALLSILQRLHLSSVLEEIVFAGVLGPVKEPLMMIDSAHPAGRFHLSFGEPNRRKVEATLGFRSYDYDHSMH